MTDLMIREHEVPVAAGTQYLAVYDTGAVICDVHEMIDRIQDGEQDPSVLLIAPGGNTIVVDVEDVSGGHGTEWEIIGYPAYISQPGPGDAVVFEYINYTELDRSQYDEHNIDQHTPRFVP